MTFRACPSPRRLTSPWSFIQNSYPEHCPDGCREAWWHNHTRFDGIGVDCFGEHDDKRASQLVRLIIELCEHATLVWVQLEVQSEVREDRPPSRSCGRDLWGEKILVLGQVAHVLVGGDEVRYRDKTSRAWLKFVHEVACFDHCFSESLY